MPAFSAPQAPVLAAGCPRIERKEINDDKKEKKKELNLIFFCHLSPFVPAVAHLACHKKVRPCSSYLAPRERRFVRFNFFTIYCPARLLGTDLVEGLCVGTEARAHPHTL